MLGTQDLSRAKARNVWTSAEWSYGRGKDAAKKVDCYALAVLVLVHVGATFSFLPPWEVLRQEPLYQGDYPVHIHRVHVYRQGLSEGGLPWGYDPLVSAGLVEGPAQDVGAKALQVVGILLPFLAPSTVVRLFVFFAALTMPLWTFLACRRLRIPTGAQVWVMATLVGPAWLYYWFASYLLAGMVGFAIASYFAPYVLALFLDFISRPCIKIYLAFCLAAALLFQLHALGPVVLVPPLVFSTLAAKPLLWRWRIAAFLAPLIVLVFNGFWFLPCLLSMMRTPSPPWSTVQGDKGMIYRTWSEIMEGYFPFRALIAISSLALAIYGFAILRKIVGRRVMLAFLIAGTSALLLKYTGSFLPVIVRMQPNRFMLPAFVVLALPVGVALFALTMRAQLPAALSATVLGFILAAGALVLGKPNRLLSPPPPSELAEFITRRTAPTDRLLVQTVRWSEPRVLPLAFGREVIGNSYPFLEDPAQFLTEDMWWGYEGLWGKDLNSWSPTDLRSTLGRWGIAWIFSGTEKARVLLAKAIGTPGEAVGRYHAFRVPGPSPTRFLVGKGRLLAKFNRLELTDLTPSDALVVIRYRYHPAWFTNSGVPVHRYPVPEDPVGFIALRNPSKSVTLSFDSWEMLRAPWQR